MMLSRLVNPASTRLSLRLLPSTASMLWGSGSGAWSTLQSTPPMGARGYIYANYQKPIHLKPGEVLKTEDDRNYQKVAPPSKWDHGGSNYDRVTSKFMSLLFKNGKREVSRSIIRKTFAEIKFIQLAKYNNASTDEERQKIELNPTKILNRAIENCTPVLITQQVLRGAIIYKVPFPPRHELDAMHRSIGFILNTIRDKNAKERVWVTIAREVIAAANNEGKSVRQKEEMHKMCEENRAYASYRRV